MKGTRFLPVAIALVILLAFSAGLSAANSARGSEPSQSYQVPQGTSPQAWVGTAPSAVLGTGFTYQGQLLKDGSPVNATCTMVFSLYDDDAAGSQQGDPITLTVAVAGGLFTALLNSDGEFGLGAFDGTARWLEVAVQCPGDPAFSTLAPRQALTATPYALSLRPGARVEGDTTGTIISTRNRGEGDGLSGRSDSTHGRGVYGWVTATSGETHGVEGTSASPNGVGVYGRAGATSGETHGVEGQADAPFGRGVYGYAGATSGPNIGVQGETNSTEGFGVYGYATATSGATHGVYGLTLSPAGVGVHGYAQATDGLTYGVYGQAASPGGRGVYGLTTSGSGGTCGVYGFSQSTAGYAVYGYAGATSGSVYGVFGRTISTDGRGVAGHAVATSGLNYGVLGRTDSTEGYGVYSIGDFGATGSKAAIVPTQAYGWRHLYTVESPDVLFEDAGTAQLVAGQAVVTIDPVFAQTVNLEQPYQVLLTAQGDCGLYVAAKQPASFTVRALDGKTCSTAFDYRIIAKRLGYEGVRLAPAGDPPWLEPAASQP